MAAVPDPPRYLGFSKEHNLYLILNLFHDIVHDYGNASGDRWKATKKILTDYYTSLENPLLFGGQSNRKKQALNNDTDYYDAEPKIKLLIEGESISQELDKYIDSIENEILMAIFHMFITTLNNPEYANPPTVKDYLYFVAFIPRISNDQVFVNAEEKEYMDLFGNLSNLLIDFFENNMSLSEFVNFKKMLYDAIDDGNFQELSQEFRVSVEAIEDLYKNNKGVFDWNIWTLMMKKKLEKDNTQSLDVAITQISNLPGSVSLEYLMQAIHFYFTNFKSEIRCLIYSYVSRNTIGAKNDKTPSKFKVPIKINTNKRRPVPRNFPLVPPNPPPMFNFNSSHQTPIFAGVPGGSKQRGGKCNSISLEQADQLISDITPYLQFDQSTPIFQDLTDMAASYESEHFSTYNQKRKNLIEKITSVFIANNASDCANSLNTIKGPLSERVISRHKINVVANVLETIELCANIPRKIIKKRTEEENRRQQQIADDIRKNESGGLNSSEKTLVGNFMQLIAKMGLSLTGITSDGNIQGQYTDPTLRTEIGCLMNVAGYRQQFILSKAIGIDDILIAHFMESSEPLGHRYECRGTERYVINNAAPIRTSFNDNKTFCPYTSILDGMKNCSWKGAARNNLLECGNMNFVIGQQGAESDNSLWYNGKLIILPNSQIRVGTNDIYNTVCSEFTVNFPTVNDANGRRGTPLKVRGFKPQIEMASDDLDAAVVLRQTLLVIAQSIIPGLSGNHSAIWDQIYQHMTDTIQDPRSNSPIPIFDLILRELWFKLTGDLFQEINAVARFGGYVQHIQSTNHPIGTPAVVGVQGTIGYPQYVYTNTEEIEQHDQNGCAIRFFPANDRPSGTRFGFMLKNGILDQINIKAFGGYYSSSTNEVDNVLFKHPRNTNTCTPNAYGGSNKKSTKKIKIPAKKQKRRRTRKISKK
jgi:hypothetical protein